MVKAVLAKKVQKSLSNKWTVPEMLKRSSLKLELNLIPSSLKLITLTTYV
jgi:hypothetical protein